MCKYSFVSHKKSWIFCSTLNSNTFHSCCLVFASFLSSAAQHSAASRQKVTRELKNLLKNQHNFDTSTFYSCEIQHGMKIQFKVTLNILTNCWRGFALFYIAKLQFLYITCLLKLNSLKYQITVCFWTAFPRVVCTLQRDRASIQTVGGAIEKKKLRHLLHHVRIKLSFCNYYVNCNCKQDIYCHCFKHNTKSATDLTILVSKRSILSAVIFELAADRKVEPSGGLWKSIWAQHCPHRLADFTAVEGHGGDSNLGTFTVTLPL